MKTYVHTKTCMCVFIAALIIITKNWKQLKCPSVDKQINCGTLLSNKKEQNIDKRRITDESQRYYASERRQSQNVIHIL